MKNYGECRGYRFRIEYDAESGSFVSRRLNEPAFDPGASANEASGQGLKDVSDPAGTALINSIQSPNSTLAFKSGASASRPAEGSGIPAVRHRSASKYGSSSG
jgi:hypothetical protein